MTIHALDAFADPTIALRSGVTLVGAAAAGAALMLMHLALPRNTSRGRTVLLPAAESGFIYLLLGLGSRFAIQHHRSRLQIMLLLGAVAGVELVRARRGGLDLPRVTSWLTGSVAVCLGVVAAKWALEPGALTEAVDHQRRLDDRA